MIDLLEMQDVLKQLEAEARASFPTSVFIHVSALISTAEISIYISARAGDRIKGHGKTFSEAVGNVRDALAAATPGAYDAWFDVKQYRCPDCGDAVVSPFDHVAVDCINREGRW